MRARIGGSHFWGALVLELLAVFIGITAGFLLDGYRQERGDIARRDQAEQADVARREQIVDALVQEIQSISDEGRPELAALEDVFREFNEQRNAGERPAVTPFFPSVGFRGDMWEAALQMGGVELLDVDVAMRVSTFYAQVRAMGVTRDRLTQLSIEILTPNLDAGPDEFYDARAVLRPKYQWYPNQMRALLRQASDVMDQADSLVVLLRPYGSPAVIQGASSGTTLGTDTTSAIAPGADTTSAATPGTDTTSAGRTSE